MSCTTHIAAINDLVDGTIGAIRRAELEQHLETCAGCRALLEDLQRVQEAAAALPELPPPDGAWLQIAGRLRQEGRVHDMPVAAAARRLHPAWLAAAAALVIAAAASIMVVFPRGTQPAAPPSAPAAAVQGNAPGTESVEAVQNEVEAAQQDYEKAIAKLQKVADANKQALDPATAATLEKNIGITDMAIDESRAAVRSEPTNAAARETLFDALRQKVALLQDTIALVNEMRKGNNAGAAQMLDKS